MESGRITPDLLITNGKKLEERYEDDDPHNYHHNTDH